MAMKIGPNLCSSCGDCKPECPTESIKVKKGTYVINPDTCTECEGEYDEPKCVEVCTIDDCILPLVA